MSYDISLPTVCNHKIFKELIPLGSDLRSLRMAQPLASSVDIQVFASDDLVPKTMYSVIYDPTTINVNQPRMVYLNKRWKQPRDFFQISYVTLRSFCPKCVGLEVLDDYSYNVKGQLVLARDEKLLLQNLEKWTVTEILSNVFHHFIGTSLVSLLGEKIADLDYLATKITQEINSALTKFSDMQDQHRQSGRALTNGEILSSVDNIEVLPDENDPTILRCTVSCMAKSGKSIEYEQYLKTPEA